MLKQLFTSVSVASVNAYFTGLLLKAEQSFGNAFSCLPVQITLDICSDRIWHVSHKVDCAL